MILGESLRSNLIWPALPTAAGVPIHFGPVMASNAANLVATKTQSLPSSLVGRFWVDSGVHDDDAAGSWSTESVPIVWI